MTDLHWLGLDWDEGPDIGGPAGPYRQSERLPLYDAALLRLIDAELVYPCTCTRADIARAASAPHADDEGPVYPGTCATRTPEAAAELPGTMFAWRFRVPPGLVTWQDLVAGPTQVDPRRHGGDFVVARDGVGPSYQLAVVVDDAAMGVTQVLRGADLLASTPRQLLLYRALQFPAPTSPTSPSPSDPTAVGSPSATAPSSSKRSASKGLTPAHSSVSSPSPVAGPIASSPPAPPTGSVGSTHPHYPKIPGLPAWMISESASPPDLNAPPQAAPGSENRPTRPAPRPETRGPRQPPPDAPPPRRATRRCPSSGRKAGSAH